MTFAISLVIKLVLGTIATVLVCLCAALVGIAVKAFWDRWRDGA